MAQISRPFQIVLAVFVLFAVAWFAVIHRPGGESTTSGSSPSASSSGGAPVPAIHHHARVAPVAHPAKAAAAAHVKSVKPATAERHKAVAHARAARSGRAAAHASHQSPTAAATAATAAFTLHNLTAALHLNTVVKLVELLDPALNLKAKVAHDESVFVARLKTALQPASQATVVTDLHDGRTVLLLFVNPHSYDDDATAIDAVEVAHRLSHKVALHLMLAHQVNSFGSITRDIQVYQTPTLLIVNAKRQVEPLPGLLDAYAIEQAVAETRGEAVKPPA